MVRYRDLQVLDGAGVFEHVRQIWRHVHHELYAMNKQKEKLVKGTSDELLEKFTKFNLPKKYYECRINFAKSQLKSYGLNVE